MNSYISGVRRKESGVFHNISKKFSKMAKVFKAKETVPVDLSEHKIHVEEHKPGFFQRLFKGKTVKEQEEIEETMEKGPEKVKEKMEEAVDEYETLEEVEHHVEEKKEGMISRFMGVFKSKPKMEESEDVPAEQVQRVMSGKPAHSSSEDSREDLKKVSKIALSLIKKLPYDEQEAFKRSPEFSEYKKILDKHGLVK